MGGKDRINKQPTSAARAERSKEYGMTGNVRRKGQDPSPDDRERGERADGEKVTGEPADRG